MLRKLVIKQGDPSSQIKHFFKESNCLILHFEKKSGFWASIIFTLLIRSFEGCLNFYGSLVPV